MLDDCTRRDLWTAGRPFLAFGLFCGCLTGWFLAPAGWSLALSGAVLMATGATLFALIVGAAWVSITG